jgi:hypothetical protein
MYGFCAALSWDLAQGGASIRFNNQGLPSPRITGSEETMSHVRRCNGWDVEVAGFVDFVHHAWLDLPIVFGVLQYTESIDPTILYTKLYRSVYGVLECLRQDVDTDTVSQFIDAWGFQHYVMFTWASQRWVKEM